MAKLKISEKYEEYKKKKASVMKKCRQKKKMSEVEMPAPKLAQVVKNRRDAVRERVRRCRERKRLAQINSNEQKETATVDIEENSRSILSSGYNSVQALGKAVNKVTRAFPVSPTKRKTVLARILSKMNDAD